MGLDGSAVVFAAHHLDGCGVGSDLHTLIGAAEGHGTAALAAEGEEAAHAGNKGQRLSVGQAKGRKDAMGHRRHSGKDHQTVEGGTQAGQTPYAGGGDLPAAQQRQEGAEGQQAVFDQAGLQTADLRQRRQAEQFGKGQIAAAQQQKYAEDHTAGHTHQFFAQFLDGTGGIIEGDIEEVVGQFLLFLVILLFDVIFLFVVGYGIGNKLAFLRCFFFVLPIRIGFIDFILFGRFLPDMAALEQDDTAAGGLVAVQLLIIDDDVAFRFGFRLGCGTGAERHGDRFFFGGRIGFRILPLGHCMQLFDPGFGDQQVGQTVGLGHRGFLCPGRTAALGIDLGDDIVDGKALLLAVCFLAQKITCLCFQKGMGNVFSLSV